MEAKIPEKLIPLLEPIDQIHESPRNPRVGHDVEAIARSISELGWHAPIVATLEGEVIVGNGRLKAARSLGLDQVPVLRVADGDREAVQRMVIDNRLTEISQWDLELLQPMVEVLDDWPTLKLSDVLADLEPPKPQKDPGPQINTADELKAKWGTETGQLWQLGDHRLLCGDSTKAEDVDRAMGGETARYGIHDPPYGINVVGKQRSTDGGSGPFGAKSKGRIGFHGVVAANEYAPVIGDDSPFDPAGILGYSKDSLLWGANYYADKLPPRKGWVVWDKKNRDDWRDTFSDCELAWTSLPIVTKIFRHTWMGMVQSGSREKRVHPTQKPAALYSKIISELFVDDGVIIDFYSGSGTTIIACEQLGRKCRAIEISPAYVAVALQRWADMTGLEPTLIP